MLHWHAAWFLFLQSFTFAMKNSQVCKWCISSDGRTEQILCCLLILNICCKFPPCIILPAGQGIFQGPVGFSPALCEQLAKIAFPPGMLPRLCSGRWLFRCAPQPHGDSLCTEIVASSHTLQKQCSYYDIILVIAIMNIIVYNTYNSVLMDIRCVSFGGKRPIILIIHTIMAIISEKTGVF